MCGSLTMNLKNILPIFYSFALKLDKDLITLANVVDKKIFHEKGNAIFFLLLSIACSFSILLIFFSPNFTKMSRLCMIIICIILCAIFCFIVEKRL